MGMKTGVIGLGAMGAPMARNLRKAGHLAAVWNRSAEKAQRLAAGHGGLVASSPAELARQCELVILSVSADADVLEVIEVLLPGLGPGKIVVDTSTVSRETARQAAARLGQTGAAFLDAPVSGGIEGARKGTLAMMVGGDPDILDRVRPVLAAIAERVEHMGPVGAGQATKAVNQVILSGVYLGVAEGMVLAMKSGLDAAQVAEALAGGAAGSWVLQNRSGRMIEDDYPLGFRIALHLKDLGIALEQAREVGAALPVAAMAAQIEAGLVARGHGDDDNSALARAIREWSGL